MNRLYGFLIGFGFMTLLAFGDRMKLGGSDFMDFAVVIFVLLSLIFYMIPSIISGKRNTKHFGMICFINVVFGWTVLGWIAALVWAVVEGPEEPVAMTKRSDVKSFLLIIALWLAFSSVADARDSSQVRKFKKMNPCPATGKASGPCVGFVIDHVTPLCLNGADRPDNMQWQTRWESLEKDKLERAACATSRRYFIDR